MRKPTLPDLSIALTFLRLGQGWSQAQLGKAAGTEQINEYERGRKILTRERLEHLIAFMGLPPEAIDITLDCLVATRAAGRAPRDSADPLSPTQRQVEVVAARFARLAHGFARSALSLLTLEGEALHARQRAEFLWSRLKRRNPADRRKLVEQGMRFRTWALCELVARESITAAPNHPREALELAELALLIAERAPGEALWLLRPQGYAWAYVSNGRRVCNDLPGADEAFNRARKLWESGASADPGLLNPAWLPRLEASLRREQRRFAEALKRIDEALALEQNGELRGEILLKKSAIFQILADPKGSAAALFEAAPLIDPDRQPRNALVLRFNLLVDLCHLDRFAEAEPKLNEVRELAERLGEELDLTRVAWLTGKIAAGLGRTTEAQRAFEQARKVFARRELTWDYAVVSLELALILLEQNRVSETRRLAEEMLRIFQAQKVEREALAALQIFCDAARQETATVEQTRQIVGFLYRARHNPELRFETEKGAEARREPNPQEDQLVARYAPAVGIERAPSVEKVLRAGYASAVGVHRAPHYLRAARQAVAVGIDRAAAFEPEAREEAAKIAKEIPWGGSLGVALGRRPWRRGPSPGCSECEPEEDQDGCSAKDSHDQFLSGRRLASGPHGRRAPASPEAMVPGFGGETPGRVTQRHSSGG